MSETAAVTGATGELRLSRDGKPLRCLVLRHGRVSQPPANLADLSEILKGSLSPSSPIGDIL
jgi:hypothetical protein